MEGGGPRGALALQCLGVGFWACDPSRSNLHITLLYSDRPHSLIVDLYILTCHLLGNHPERDDPPLCCICIYKEAYAYCVWLKAARPAALAPTGWRRKEGSGHIYRKPPHPSVGRHLCQGTSALLHLACLHLSPFTLSERRGELTP